MRTISSRPPGRSGTVCSYGSSWFVQRAMRGLEASERQAALLTMLLSSSFLSDLPLAFPHRRPVRVPARSQLDQELVHRVRIRRGVRHDADHDRVARAQSGGPYTNK